MKRFVLFLSLLSVLVLVAFAVHAVPTQMSDAELIASAESAGPETITQNATIKTMDGRVLREGTSSWTCYSGNEMAGPMCNQPQWDEVIGALMAKAPVEVKEVSISYMLAGEGDAPGGSNIDPFATEPTPDNQWIKEGPHLMILVPDLDMLEGLSTDPEDPVYVMWKGTPYAHIMVRIAEQE